MRSVVCKTATVALAFALVVGATLSVAANDPAPSREELLKVAIEQIIKMQEAGGQWPYEGVYRVNRELPVGYRVGGTSIVAQTLMCAAPDNPEAKLAIAKGLEHVIRGLGHPLMAPDTRDVYDVRIWGHACALEFLCHVRAAKIAGEHANAVDTWIKRLIETLTIEEIAGGGWNYANHRQAASFVTAPVTQALLVARAQGEKVPDELLLRARKALEGERTPDGGFRYSGAFTGGTIRPIDKVQGSSARSTVCESTLILLGGGSTDAVRASLNIFHSSWDELKKRHQQPKTHEPPFQIAPYFFYYGHRYAAQAIQMLPESERAKERDRLLEVILRTREANGTWNDRIFPRSANYGTSMIVLALLGDQVPLPPKFEPTK